MRKVAIFGNAGGGKSTLARRLAEITGLPLFAIDVIPYAGGKYRPELTDGGAMSEDEFARLHREILSSEAWIIDGYGGAAPAWERFAAADTLIHVDLPLALHFWGVTKRLALGLLKTPRGWPDGAPVWGSSMQSYSVLWRCHVALTPRYRRLVAEAEGKRAYRLTSYAAMAAFLAEVRRETSA